MGGGIYAYRDTRPLARRMACLVLSLAAGVLGLALLLALAVLVARRGLG